MLIQGIMRKKPEVAHENYFTPKEVCKVAAISYRQVQYWDKTRFIKPTYMRRGKYRLYTFADLLLIKLASNLRDVNVSIQKLRRIIRSVADMLKHSTKPLSELSFLIDPGPAYCPNGEPRPTIIMFDGLMRANAQAELKFLRFDVGTLRADIERIWPDPLAPDIVPNPDMEVPA